MKRRNRKSPFRPRTVEFEIDHIDPLGQGVSKKAGNITFVAGTLPGETGTALVYKRARGVQFAHVQQLDTTAGNRVEPECPHFNQCPGCQFLHTDYESELVYKKTTLARALGILGVSEEDIDVVSAPRRLSYRNRVQLHYRHKYIGMLDTVSNEVLEVPRCKIVRQELRSEFDHLYQGDWRGDHTGHGHCEIYFRSGEVSVRWDEDYAHGGFSQVYEEMNLELQQRVQTQMSELSVTCLLDLFSGTGNLSDMFASSGGKRVLIDSYFDTSDKTRPANFHRLDLYDEQTLPGFTRKSGSSDFDALLIDPPRRGFPELHRWVKKIKPRYVIYVSCNASTLVRDLRNLSTGFRFKNIQLLDMFPATSHFETLVVLEMRQASR
ncbi:MAG: class I SAM-dependent RNA methyltransferase [Gammaproteobacteria bacterium]|nr:class I SAM-dependent RNA methyltransferase [Gammaproteobacteria bacterium]